MSDTQIIEGLVSTTGSDGEVHVTAMGPRFDLEERDHFELRPFLPSTTWENLQRVPCGVFHVTDDVGQLARIVMRRAMPAVRWETAQGRKVPVVEGVCRWWAFEATRFHSAGERGTIRVRLLKCREERPFVGLHRARHAVLEAAILATRVGILPAAEIHRQLDHVRPWVEKTGSAREKTAFAELCDYIAERMRTA